MNKPRNLQFLVIRGIVRYNDVMRRSFLLFNNAPHLAAMYTPNEQVGPAEILGAYNLLKAIAPGDGSRVQVQGVLKQSDPRVVLIVRASGLITSQPRLSAKDQADFSPLDDDGLVIQ